MSDPAHLIAVVLAWALYGLMHSWLAGTNMKDRVARCWPALAPAYRLLYNAQAIVLLIPPLWLTWTYTGTALWHWPAWISWSAALAVVAGYLWSLRWYDGLDFIGLRQWRARDVGVGWSDRLYLSPLHRHVRHPWYSLGLLFLWTRDLNAAWLVATLAITVYLIVGSRLEDRKLIAVFGEPYRRYAALVPGLLPSFRRHLSAADAAKLLDESGRD
jgi:protein-S-isoprenylcysteine O-methyltransferase Ste14